MLCRLGSRSLPAGRRFLSAARGKTLGARETGVWMRKDLEHGLDPVSLAVMGPNLKWQVVREGEQCVQEDTKPRDFDLQICDVKDTIPDYHDYHEGDGSTALEAFHFGVGKKIALSATGATCELELDKDFLYDLWNIPGLVGVYSDPENKTLDKDSRRLLSFLKKQSQDIWDVYYDHEQYLLEEKYGDMYEGPDLQDLKNFHDHKWVEKVATRLHKEGWELRWDVSTYSAGDVLGVEHFGRIFLGDGVSVHEDQEWDRDCDPFLYLPCFEGEL